MILSIKLHISSTDSYFLLVLISKSSFFPYEAVLLPHLDLSNLEHDHSGKTTVHLKMKGDVDDPKISFNSLQLKEDIIKEIKNETLEIIDIIGDGILNPNQENATDSTQISDIEIKWEDDDDDYKKN